MSEISQLRARVAELESRLVALEPKKPAPAPAKHEEPQVRITNYIEHGVFVMPDEAQSRQLLDIVQARYSAFKLVGDVTARDLETELCRFRASFGISAMLIAAPMARLIREDMPPGFAMPAATGCAPTAADTARTSRLRLISAPRWHMAISPLVQPTEFRTGYGFGISIIPIGSGGKKCSHAWTKLLDGSIRVRELERIAVQSEKSTSVRIFNVGA